ncbi:MAG TPA: hypothetical protein VFJ20_01445 [Gemmatimonadaceae bacterium]|nr:hypothetical protein [Gemmatimonadaceae bacterium]
MNLSSWSATGRRRRGWLAITADTYWIEIAASADVTTIDVTVDGD